MKICTYLHHIVRIFNNLLSALLHLRYSDVPAVHRVDVGNHGREAGLVLNARRGVDNIGTDDDGRVLRVREHGDGTSIRHGVDASELNIDSVPESVTSGERIRRVHT